MKKALILLGTFAPVGGVDDQNKIKTDAQNQFFIDQIYRIGNDLVLKIGTGTGINPSKDFNPFTPDWHKIVRDADVYARTKFPEAIEKYSRRKSLLDHESINGITGTLTNNLGEFAIPGALSTIKKLKGVAAQEIAKIRKSIFTSREKRFVVERYYALLQVLEDIANALTKAKQPA